MGKVPDFEIRAMRKGGDISERGKIGVGWKQDDGSISIKFDYFVKVPVGPEFLIRLFPQDGLDRSRKVGPQSRLTLTPQSYDPDDEIPF